MSARLFTRLLKIARNARISYDGKFPVVLAAHRYVKGDAEELSRRQAEGTTRVPSAPGFLREPEHMWPVLDDLYFGRIEFDPYPAAGGCTVVAPSGDDELALRVRAQFKQFSKLGGSHLPDSILRSRNDWPIRMLDRWLTFLWESGVLDQAEDALLLTFDAFDASARAIERCGLDTDSPTFPGRQAKPADAGSEGGVGNVWEDAAGGDDAPKPSWDRTKGVLRFNGEAIKEIRRIGVAKNVVLVLDTFQELGWPDRVDSPLSPNSQKHHATINSLNTGLSRIWFKSDGEGRGFIWGTL